MENIADRQRGTLEGLQDRVDDLEVRWSDERGVASVLDGDLLPWDEVGNPEEIIPRVLEEFGDLLGPPEVVEAYRMTGIRTDKSDGGYRARAYQAAAELPIYGATLLVFASEERGVHRVQSSFWREVNITADQQLDNDALQGRLHERLREDPDAAGFEDEWRAQDPDAWEEEHFPLTGYPTLYLYRVEDGFRPAYHALAYQPTTWRGITGAVQREIGRVQMIVDASNGEVLLEESMKIGMAYADHTGDGRSTLQDNSGNYLTRSLRVVRKDSADYYLWNRTHTPHIRTTDAGGTKAGLEGKLKDDSKLSKNSDLHWNTTTTSCTTNTRRDAQQPEVDCHFYAEEAWNFYNGFKWQGFDDGNYGTHCLVRTAAHIGTGINAYFSAYAEPIPGTGTNKYHGFIAFYDGHCDGTTLKFDFMAGDPVAFGHEYQHAVTFFGAAKSNGEPGHIGLTGWPRGIHEGYSDAISALRCGKWTIPLFWRAGPIRSGSSFTMTVCGNSETLYCQPWRRIEYPRSTKTHFGDRYCDHYDDRNDTQSTPCFSLEYFVSTLLSHVAYLAGQGGVHQRNSRSAKLIPVQGVGLERVAEIYLKALTKYFDTLPTKNSGETMIDAGEYILKAAKDVAGSDRKCEYVMLRRAFYAVGLHPYDGSHNKQKYGGEACMLPWTYSWRFSRPYLGMPALWWQSPDLFINNNGSREYNAKVGQENKLFARVRNIGDADLKNVKVKFYFRPMGTNLPTSIAGWHKCQDKNNNDCVLDIATLKAGKINFTNVNNPPTNQAVEWYFDSSYVTSAVDHVCLRAVIECEAKNHNNDCANQVQSNIQYTQPGAGAKFGATFEVANWLPEPKPLELEVTSTLPEGYQVVYTGDKPLDEIVLVENEPEIVSFEVEPPARRIDRLEPPYDGRLVAEMAGKIVGRLAGELSDTEVTKEVPRGTVLETMPLTAFLAAEADTSEGPATLTGDFAGELDTLTGEIRGELLADVALEDGRLLDRMPLRLEGCLDPLRAVHFAQLIDGEVVGGVTLKVTFPALPGQRIP